MGIEIQQVINSGGRGLLDLLEYCVISAQPDPLFAFLAGEYRMRPTLLPAIALYEAFCAPEAAARLSVTHVLPPRDLHLSQQLLPMCEAWSARDTALAEAPEGDVPPPVQTPPRYLFDPIVTAVRQGGPWRRIAQGYDPVLTPYQNLPGGRMSPGQRAFLDNVWLARVRPYLVAAGFPRVATVG